MNFYKMLFDFHSKLFGFKIETPKDLQDFVEYFHNFSSKNFPQNNAEISRDVEIMKAEQFHLANGGIIVVDEEMAEAFARTDIDNIYIEDIYMPFRSIELAIPKTICERFGIMPLIVLPPEGYKDGEMYYTAYVCPKDDNLTPCPCYHKANNVLISPEIGEQEKLSYFSKPANVKFFQSLLESDDVCERSWKFFLVVMLYLQSQDAQKALEETSIKVLNQNPEQVGVKKMRKKCKSYKLVNILSRKNVQYVGTTGRHHASPEAHWVKGYMQYFKHERYYRNPNGSIKTHWVLPYPRGEGKDKLDMRALRALTA